MRAAMRLSTLQVRFLLFNLWKLYVVVRLLDVRHANAFTENACAAIAKILHFNKQSVENPQAVANQWYLPLFPK